MLGIYFSGTGNSRYAAELFCREYDKKTRVLSIEDSDVLTAVNDANLIVFAYPVQFSTVPKIMRDFVTDNKGMWRNKKVFVIATMGLFSGDGAGMLDDGIHPDGKGARRLAELISAAITSK